MMGNNSHIKLALKTESLSKTFIKMGNTTIGKDFLLIAGPCCVEEEYTTLKIAEKIADLGIQFFRAGAFKPRTSPYSFQGYAHQGLKILNKVKQETGLHIVTEALDIDIIDEVAGVADIIQVGSRNMSNSRLLKKAASIDKPILLKRGFSATLEEFLLAAEYILYAGNPDVILCERGIRTFDSHCRFTLDIAAVPSLSELTHLPVIVDPSHAAGRRSVVPALCCASIAAGADGLIIESHIEPEKALCDKEQTINIAELDKIRCQIDFFRQAH